MKKRENENKYFLLKKLKNEIKVLIIIIFVILHWQVLSWSYTDRHHFILCPMFWI